ncbi:MAG: hypothetical protein C5B49_05795 [Bdellovibrio sp.]|nr:MAG: hypothetical protein C5B49_05795 [Bdellovibrio sp.]
MKAKNCSWPVIFVTFLISCSWFEKPENHDPVQKIDAKTIRVAKEALDNLKITKAENKDFPDLLSLMGKISVTEDRTTIVPARVAGRMEAIYFASGEHVNQGQILATMFSPDFIAAREEYLLSLKQANQKESAGDPSDFANLAQMARKKLETMGLNSEDIGNLAGASADDSKKFLLNVRAPRSGVLIQKSAVLGNLQNLGDTLFIIGDLSKVWFSGDLYPEDLPKVYVGQKVFINAVGVNVPLYGKVSFISPLVDPNTRSIKIRASMENPNKALKMDEYVQGNVVLAEKTTLVVPTDAIVRTPEGPVMFKRVAHLPKTLVDPSDAKKLEIDESMDFQLVTVSVGKEQSGMSSILTGLQAGDEVVSEGSWLLNSALNSAKQ